MGTLDQIRELIPAEAAALYIAGLGVIPLDQLAVIVIWALLGLVVTILVKTQNKHRRISQQVRQDGMESGHCRCRGVCHLGVCVRRRTI